MDQAGIRLTGIRIYPLKGAGAVELRNAETDALGLVGDRRWMLVDPGGIFVSQRTHPRLALIRVTPVDDEPFPAHFHVTAPGFDPLLLPRGKEDTPPVAVTLHGQEVQARPAGEDGADRWFSSFLGQACRLVFFPGEYRRPVNPRYAPGHKTAFADGYPILLASEESLSALNRHLPEPSSMARFRPNLTVAGGEAWGEDRWRRLQVGDARLQLVKPCDRCTVTTVDQDTGERGKEPLKTLARVRAWDGRCWFGQNAVVERSGSFRVGSDVGILEEGDPRPPLG